ncbi:hypothetical protein MTO96_028589 [Rhipicephalus appendiculatus]
MPVMRQPAANLEDQLAKLMRSAMRFAMPMAQEVMAQGTVSSACISSLLVLCKGLTRYEIWALKFVESAGFPEGVLEMNSGSLGRYDECLSIEVPDDANSSLVAFRGSFCSVFVKMRGNPFIRKLMRRIFESTPQIKMRLESFEEFENLQENSYQQGLRAALCAPSTCTAADMEILLTADKTAKVQILLAFSGVTNTQRLFDLNAGSAGRLRCLEGVRFLSAVWVVFLHNYIIAEPNSMGIYFPHIRDLAINFRKSNVLDIFALKSNIVLTSMFSGYLSIETFFMLSGFLVAYAIFNEVHQKKEPIPWPVKMLRRHVRLTGPAFLFVLFALLYPALLSGPVADHITGDNFVKPCQKSWWTSLVHVLNIQPTEKLCVGHMWYLSCNFQIYLACFGFIVLMKRKPLIGGLCLVVLSAAATVAVAVQVYSCRYGAFLMMGSLHIEPTLERICLYHLDLGLLDAPFLVREEERLLELERAGEGDVVRDLEAEQLLEPRRLMERLLECERLLPLGVLPITFGTYTCCLTNTSSLSRWAYSKRTPSSTKNWARLHGVRVAVLWVVALAITTLVCLFPYAWDSASIPYDPVLAAVYASLYPVLWSVSLSWMLHSCITGTAGLVNRFLSMGVFIPLAKLSFSLYLVHPYVLFTKVANMRDFRALDQWAMLTDAIWLLFLSLFFAFIFYIVCECPITNLDKVALDAILKRRRRDATNVAPPPNVRPNNIELGGCGTQGLTKSFSP